MRFGPFVTYPYTTLMLHLYRSVDLSEFTLELSAPYYNQCLRDLEQRSWSIHVAQIHRYNIQSKLNFGDVLCIPPAQRLSYQAKRIFRGGPGERLCRVIIFCCLYDLCSFLELYFPVLGKQNFVVHLGSTNFEELRQPVVVVFP